MLGGLSGQWQPALSLGIVVELLWLDVIALGSVVPPFGTLAFLLLFPLSIIPGWSEAHQFLAPLMFAVFAAYGASYAERYQRVALNPLVDLVTAWFTSGRGCTPGQAVALGAVVRAAWQFSLYMLCYVALWLACDLLGEAIFLFEGQMGWPILFAGGRHPFFAHTPGVCLPYGDVRGCLRLFGRDQIGHVLGAAGRFRGTDSSSPCHKKAASCTALPCGRSFFRSPSVVADSAGGRRFRRHPC